MNIRLGDENVTTCLSPIDKTIAVRRVAGDSITGDFIVIRTLDAPPQKYNSAVAPVSYKCPPYQYCDL